MLIRGRFLNRKTGLGKRIIPCVRNMFRALSAVPSGKARIRDLRTHISAYGLSSILKSVLGVLEQRRADKEDSPTRPHG